tara:strand:+ start:290 stop:484 length:195 start_codon:yes stop_codon:yes gene_type:complete
MSSNIYQEHGFENRKEYLKDLADQFGVSVQTVYDLASIMGKSEDFDGLVTSLEDVESGMFGDLL